MPDFAFEDDAATDAGSESNNRHVGNAASGAEPLFTESGDVGVIFEDDASTVLLDSETAFDFSADGVIVEAGKVGGFAEHSSLHVDDAGNAEADAKEFSRLAILGGEALNGVTHFGDNVIGSESGFGAEGDFFEKLAVAGDGGDAEVGAAEVDSDGKIGHG